MSFLKAASLILVNNLDVEAALGQTVEAGGLKMFRRELPAQVAVAHLALHYRPGVAREPGELPRRLPYQVEIFRFRHRHRLVNMPS